MRFDHLFYYIWLRKTNTNVESILSWNNGKDWRTWREKKLLVDDFMLDKVLHKIKEMGIEKFVDTKILIDTDNTLPDDITLKNIMFIMDVIKKMINFVFNYFRRSISSIKDK